MRLTVNRRYKGEKYTIGSLSIDGAYFCDTLEDPDRGLTSDMSVEEILKLKVKGDTCIPVGTYLVTLNVVSNKYSNFTKYPWAKIAEGKIPRVLNVKGFDGILIHVGNKAEDTEGCLLVGENKVKGQVINSQKTWTKLYNILKEAIDNNELITIEYK